MPIDEAAPIVVAATFTANALNAMTFDQIKFVVTDFIAEGLTLFAGKPKIGKSSLLLHMAHEVAIGGYALGGLSCEQGDVLYCALEDNQRRLQRRLTKLFDIDEWPLNLTFACEMPRLANGGIKFIKDWIEKAERPRLVIIDTLAMVRSAARKDQSTYDADYAAVKKLRDLAGEHGIAIIIVHHLRKADADDPFDTVSGTLGLTGCPDSIMIIWRESNGVLLAAKGRDIEEIKKSVQFDAATCTWNVIGDAEAVRRSVERSAIIKAFEEANGEPLGPRQIAEAVGMKAVNVRQLMNKMKQEGIIKVSSYGKYVLATAKEV
jgi:RecA-family ATPase